MQRSWLSFVAAGSAGVVLAGLVAVSGCSANVEDTGKWGDLSKGGDVSLLKDAGTYCVGWDSSQYGLPTDHACMATNSDCDAWAKSALPPQFPNDGLHCQMEAGGPGHDVCLEYAYCNNSPACHLGAAGDAYCSAWAEAWMQPGAEVHGICLDNPDSCYDQKCMFDRCPDTDHPCDPTKVCVKRADGSFGCEAPCSG